MPSLFAKDISVLSGVGPKRAGLFSKLGAPTVGDLLRLYPRVYEDWSLAVSVAEAVINEINVIKAQVLAKPSEQRISGGRLLYKARASDGKDDIQLTFFNNRYIPVLLKEGETYIFRGKVTGSFLKKEMLSPEFTSEQKACPVMPVYTQTAGLTSRQISAAVKNALKLLPETLNDPLPADIRKKYELCELMFALHNIHFPESLNSLSVARRRLIFEEFLVLQLGLASIKSVRRKKNRHWISPELPEDFFELLPFSLTGAQKRAIGDAVADMSGDHPMNRLVQGDVGSGKTAVAAALIYSAARAGMQSAMMAPTEILAQQHYKSLSALFEKAGIKSALLTGSVKPKEKGEILSGLESGEIQLAVGTHALISERVNFKNLGLVVTDEQHRFGVNQRSALAEKGELPHLLVMSATPIPRTLALMIYGDLDISVLNELPPGRQKIDTFFISSSKRKRAFGFIKKHIDEGRQGYLICPLIEDDESGAASVESYIEAVRKLLPGVSVAALHGRMKPAEKNAVMQEFSDGKIQLLVSTTVVEVGVDVPNAVIMLIENAERYGLSQLHQLRGRIGRGIHKSTCILVSDAENEQSIERLRVMCKTSDGFKIADEDLRLRGPGDFFGQRQHGLPQLKIADLSTDMELLKNAQECAVQLMADGAKLVSCPGLRAEVKKLMNGLEHRY